MKALTYAGLVLTVSSLLRAQPPSNPTHPYLLFHASDVGPSGPLHQRLVPTSAPLHFVYATLATTIRPYTYNGDPFSIPPPPFVIWASDTTQAFVRDLTDVAFRASVEEHGVPRASTVLANLAITNLRYLLFASTTPGAAPWTPRENLLTRSQANAPYNALRTDGFKSWAFVAAIALCYDWLYEFMDVDERLSIREVLLRCAEMGIEAQNGDNNSNFPDTLKFYYQYKGTAVNYAFGNACIIALSLMAVEPEADAGSAQPWS